MLKGKSIILRPLKHEDWKKTITWRNDATLKKLAMMHPFPITEMNELEWYENLLKSKSDKSLFFAITMKNDSPIGFVSLNNINRTNRNCYLSIVIGDEKTKGKGYGKDTMETILNYAFNTLNLKKVSVEVVSINKSAISLYNQLGFIEEGNLVQNYFCQGEYLDVKIMSKFN